MTKKQQETAPEATADQAEATAVPEPSAEAIDGPLYAHLAAPFDVTFRDLRGGVELEYITGEQATTRLNETLGFLNWSFRIVEHGIHAEADECWALGEITVTIDCRTVARQQFGSQKIKRSRSSGTPLDVGFDLKGAATDALKKCASLVGVALYLWKKDPPAAHAGAGSQGGTPPGPINPAIVVNADGEPACQQDVGGEMCADPVRGWDAGNGHPPRDAWWVANWQIGRSEYGIPLCPGHQGAIKRGEAQVRKWAERPTPIHGTDLDTLSCEECGEPLTETRFKDGTTWAPSQLAVFGRRKHSRILCIGHYREANQNKRRAEEALQQVPF